MLTMCLDENTMSQNIFDLTPMLTIYRIFRDIFILRGIYNKYEEKRLKILRTNYLAFMYEWNMALLDILYFEWFSFH